MTAALTASHRAAQERLARRASLELLHAWPTWEVGDRASWARFSRTAFRIIEEHASKSSALGASYYRALRQQETGFTGYTPPLAPGPEPKQVDIALTATAVVSTVKALRAGAPLEQARRAGFVRATKVVERLVMDAGRVTVLEASHADAAADGWRRVTRGTCSFCAARAGEPGGSAFGSHDNCSCTAEPEFDAGRKKTEFFDRMFKRADFKRVEKLHGRRATEIAEDMFDNALDRGESPGLERIARETALYLEAQG